MALAIIGAGECINPIPPARNWGELVALCAPRPVFISGGATKGDGWVDAKGMFLTAVGAGPVYKLLGKGDMGTSPRPNWPVFLTFAGR